MGFALYELAQNQYIQDKLREEIRQYIENGKMFTYDQVKQMTYLDAVFQGTCLPINSSKSDSESNFEIS